MNEPMHEPASDPEFDHEKQNEQKKESSVDNVGTLQRIRFEWGQTMFSLQEPCGRCIDVPNSFAPDSTPYLLPIRTAFFVWSIVSLGINLVQRPEEEDWLYLAYLTHLGFLISIAYQAIACMVTYRREWLNQEPELSTLAKTMWFLYFLSVPNEIIITLLYWTIDFPTRDGTLKYSSVYTHAIILLLLLIDGNVIARIPMKIKQLWAIEVYAVFYLIWTLIHAFSGLGDGNPESGEDLLYSVIDWKEKPVKTAVTCAVIGLVVVPITFMFGWFLSLAGSGLTFHGKRRQLMP